MPTSLMGHAVKALRLYSTTVESIPKHSLISLGGWLHNVELMAKGISIKDEKNV
ncbi:MAG: hypothetical protein ACRD5J_19425 [Nitrososphaeraceae archaeon]